MPVLLAKLSKGGLLYFNHRHTLPDTYLLPALAQIFDCTIDQIIMSAIAFDADAQGDIQAEQIANRVVEKIENKKRTTSVSMITRFPKLLLNDITLWVM